ncbi:hypothetical protein PMAYCL1PPCAC_31481, partial [Pristionchus mayeri]
SLRFTMSDDRKVRIILDEKKIRGTTKYLVEWENSWSANVKKPYLMSKLAILGVTRDSYEEHQKDITKWKFIMENLNSNKDNKRETWTYHELRDKAPELLLNFYEDQLQREK